MRFRFYIFQQVFPSADRFMSSFKFSLLLEFRSNCLEVKNLLASVCNFEIQSLNFKSRPNGKRLCWQAYDLRKNDRFRIETKL